MMMRKLRIISFALFAILAVGAYMTSSAFAVSELLANGATISGDLPISITGTLLLEDEGAPGKPDIVCQGIFDGLFESGTLGFINEVLMSNGELLEATIKDLTATVSGDDIECTSANGTCSGTVLVVALHLPWHLELELLADGSWMLDFLEEAGKEPAYALDCSTIFGLVEDVCDGLVYATLDQNGVGDVLALFAVTKEGNCTLGGTASGALSGEGLIVDTADGATFDFN